MAARSSPDEIAEASIAPDILCDELAILLGFWLEMPMHDYLDDLEKIGPAVAAAIRDARHRPAGRSAKGRRPAQSESAWSQRQIRRSPQSVLKS